MKLPLLLAMKALVLLLLPISTTICSGFVLSVFPSSREPVPLWRPHRRPLYAEDPTSTGTSTVAAATTLAKPSIKTVFTDEFAEEIATLLEGQMQIPLVPSSLVIHVLTQVIAAIVAADNISPQTLESIQEVLEGEATPTALDDVEGEQINVLVTTLAGELNAVIDVPLLDEAKELEMLNVILKAIFGVLTTSKQDYDKLISKTKIRFSQDLLASEETRRAMVEHMNRIVDIPLLGEGQEEKLLTSAVEACAHVIENVLPQEVVKALSGESPDGIAKTKALVVNRINEQVDLIGLSEEQEKSLIETLVDLIINEYVDGTQAEYLFLDITGQEELLKERRDQVIREGEFSKRRFQREQKNVASKLERIDGRIEQVNKQQQ
jgi:hypothetical protein